MTLTELPGQERSRQQLPSGFRVRLRSGLVRADGGRLLVGGSPVRAVRLSDRARLLLAGGSLTVDGRATSALAHRLLEGNLADAVVDHVRVPQDDVTVVVHVRDRAEQLDRCLATLAPLHVVVVDDASRDPESVARVARRHGARLVVLADNQGPAHARNVGLRHVRTPLVAFVDSDVTVDAAQLLDLARHFADPGLALVGPRVVGVPRTERPRWEAAHLLSGPDAWRVPHEDAAATLYVLYSPQVADMLMGDYQWSPERYERWLARLILQTVIQ